MLRFGWIAVVSVWITINRDENNASSWVCFFPDNLEIKYLNCFQLVPSLWLPLILPCLAPLWKKKKIRLSWQNASLSAWNTLQVPVINSKTCIRGRGGFYAAIFVACANVDSCTCSLAGGVKKLAWNDNLCQRHKYGSKSKAVIGGLHLRYFLKSPMGAEGFNFNSKTCKYDPLTRLWGFYLQAKVSAHIGGCVSALIKRQKSSFPWQRSHDERIVPPACWTSADRGEPLSCAQPLPHSTAAVINSTAAAHLSCGLRLHCMCAPVDPPPPPLHALHTRCGRRAASTTRTITASFSSPSQGRRLSLPFQSALALIEFTIGPLPMGQHCLPANLFSRMFPHSPRVGVRRSTMKLWVLSRLSICTHHWCIRDSEPPRPRLPGAVFVAPRWVNNSQQPLCGWRTLNGGDRDAWQC